MPRFQILTFPGPEMASFTKKAKESLAVAVCNGAVYEPAFKTK